MTNLRSFDGVEPKIGAGVYVDPAAVVIGDVALDRDVSVWPSSVLRGDVHRIQVGARTNFQDGCIVHVTHDGPYSPGGIPTLVGTDVTVGHRVTLHACTVGDRCLIGMGSLIMDGAVIEDEVLLGAGSLVTPGKHLPGGALYQGRPARRIRGLTDDEIERIQYSAAHYVRLKDRYLRERTAT